MRGKSKPGLPDGSHPETTWAYFAGILDGEGNLAIERIRPKSARHHVTFYSRITVVNTSYVLIEWLVSNFGGRVEHRKIDPLKHKQTYAWRLSQTASVVLLKRCLPYLIIKRRQAELVIDFNRWRMDYRGWRTVPDEETARREVAWVEIKRLNKMGVAPAETKREGSEHSEMR